MAAITYIVKYFPEITIKSRPVRRQFVKQLTSNVRKLLGALDPGVTVHRDWEKLIITTPTADPGVHARLTEALGRISGIANYADVLEYPLGDFEDILTRTRAVYEPLLPGKTFAVRCKRAGRHDFRSVDVERYLGAELNEHCASAGVKLGRPDLTVDLEIRDDRLFVVRQRYQGLGGFPMGSLDPVLSLVSGGFDSTVASYLTMKRGLRTHFCFFNLGGRDHEVGVKEVAVYLWQRYGSSHRVRFITVPFEEVVAELLNNIEDSQMGVVLKRMMMRAAGQLADRYNINALVTGESVAQVSSQTLPNLSVIDRAADTMVLRPLIASNKEEIIRIAAEIGTEEFAANIPEYCGVISVNPTTRARIDRIIAAESRFDFDIIERAVASARVQSIDEVAAEEQNYSDVEVLSVPLAGSVIIDIRHPAEEELKPLLVPQAEVRKIPFYQLHSQMSELDRGRTYMLYCDRGVISRLHAGHLLEQGYDNVKVFQPGH